MEYGLTVNTDKNPFILHKNMAASILKLYTNLALFFLKSV